MKFPAVPLIGCVVFASMPPNLLHGDPSKLLMPFLALFMAGIFPAISLTISSLKSGGFSVKRVSNLADELSRLLDYLQALFAVALIGALCLVAAETLNWGEGFVYEFYSSRVFNVILGGCLGTLLAALPKIRRTFSTLLSISRDIAMDEASTKIRERVTKMPSVVDRFPTKEKFGELFEAEKLNPPS
jgi:hypothetical protein